MKKTFLNMVMSIKQKIININGRSQTNKYQNQTYSFYNDMTNLKYFEPNWLKIDKGINIYYIGYFNIKKTDNYQSIYSANLLYFHVNRANEYFEEKKWKQILDF